MDTFFEQIVSIKKGAKQFLALFGMWFLVLIIALAAFLFLGSFGLIITVGVGYLAYWLSGKLFVEYEYIITNGSFDIDKIVAKKSRKRIASFELSDVESITKCNRNKNHSGNYGIVLDVCNPDDVAYEMVVKAEKGSPMKIIFAPDERIRTAVLKFIPRYIANSAFKD